MVAGAIAVLNGDNKICAIIYSQWFEIVGPLTNYQRAHVLNDHDLAEQLLWPVSSFLP